MNVLRRSDVTRRLGLAAIVAFFTFTGSLRAGVVFPGLPLGPADLDVCATVVGSAQITGFRAYRSEGGVVVADASAGEGNGAGTLRPPSGTAPWPLGVGCTAGDSVQPCAIDLFARGTNLPSYTMKTGQADWMSRGPLRTGLNSDGTIRIGNPWELSSGTARIQVRRLRSEGPSATNLKINIRYFLIKG